MTFSDTLNRVLGDTSWHELAACRRSRLPEGVTSEWFVPTLGTNPQGRTGWVPKVAAAVRFCEACPVRAQCAQAGEDAHAFGVWGGRLRARQPGVSRVKLERERERLADWQKTHRP